MATAADAPGLPDADYRTSWRLPDGFFQRSEVAASVRTDWLDAPAPGDGVWAGPNQRAFVATVTAMALAAPTSRSGITVPVPHVMAEPMRRVSACDVDRIETVTQAFRVAVGQVGFHPQQGPFH
jgi:hypothetical protein